MQLNTRDLLLQAKHRQSIQLSLDYEGLLRRMLGRPGKPSLGPTPSQRKFIESKVPFKAFKGMAGVAKTTAGVASLTLRALFQPNFQGFIGRKDYNDLLGTTAKRFFEMINNINPDLIIDRDKTPPMKVWINQPGGIGIAQIDFIGLKEYPGSYEWHRGFVDEADECDKSTIETLKTRLRAPCDAIYEDDYGLDLAFNPPDKNHWLYTACTGLNEAGKKVADPTFELFEPQYGENDINLPKGYTEERFKGLTYDELERLKYGNWGSSFPGEAVFKDHFHTQTHTRDDLEWDPFMPIIHMLDFGFRHPCCIWAQLDEEMRLRILRSHLGENEEAKDFILKVKGMTNLHYPNARGKLYIGDPAAKQKKDTGSTLQVLNEQGVDLMYLEGMSIEEGLRRIRYILQMAPKGIPQLLVSKKHAAQVVRMFQGGYHKHPTTHKPVKDGTYDHIADALRYGVTNLYDADGRPFGLPTTEETDWGGNSGNIPDALTMR